MLPRRGAAVLIALGLAVLLALALWLLLGRSSGGATDRQAAVARAAFEERTGVRVTRVAVTGGGGMVDLRLQVLDPDKAAVLHDLKYPPAIIDEKSGGVADRPFMGHMVRNLETGVTYPMLIMNRRGLVKPGGRVSVRFGSSILEHVLAQ